MIPYIIQAVSALAVGMFLKLFERWLDARKHIHKKRKNKRHN